MMKKLHSLRPPPQKPPPVPTYAVLPPDGGWGWVVVASSFYCNAVIDGILLTFGLYLPELTKTYQTENALMALAGSLMYGTHLSAGPLCAGLSKGFGIRPVAVFGSFLCSFALACAGLEPPLWLFIILLGIIAGSAMCFVYMPSLAMTSMYFLRYRVLAMGIIVSGTGAGTVVFTLAGTHLLSALSWQQAFMVLSLCALGMAPASLAFRPLEPIRVTTDPTSFKESLQSISSLGSQWDDEVEDAIVLIRKESSKSTKTALSATFQASNAFFSNFYERRQFFTDDLRRFCRKCSTCRPAPAKILLLHPHVKENINDFIAKKKKFWNVRKFTARANISRWKAVTKGLTALEWRLLKAPQYLMFCLFSCLTSSAVFIIFTFERTRSDDLAPDLVMVMGASNLIWRLVLGLLSLLPFVNYKLLNITGHFIAGIFIIASEFFTSKSVLFAYSVLCALGMACNAVFRPILLHELVGAERLSDAAGISLLFTGIVATVTPPIVGWLANLVNSSALIYFWAGGSMLISTAFLIFFFYNRKPLFPEPAQIESTTDPGTSVAKREEPIVIENIQDLMNDPRDGFQIVMKDHTEIITETLPA